MKPLSDKLEENWSDFNVVFGAGSGATGHACGGQGCIPLPFHFLLPSRPALHF